MRGTESGYRLWGKRVGGSTGGTDSGKDSDAIAATSVDFPVPPSPTTATLTTLRSSALKGPTIAGKQGTDEKILRGVGVETRCSAVSFWTTERGPVPKQRI